MKVLLSLRVGYWSRGYTNQSCTQTRALFGGVATIEVTVSLVSRMENKCSGILFRFK